MTELIEGFAHMDLGDFPGVPSAGNRSFELRGQL
jgi:hypothetical protein